MSDHRPGWNAPKPDVIPRPTSWPPALALGIALIGWGLITSPLIFAIGILLFAAALAGWVREVRLEH